MIAKRPAFSSGEKSGSLPGDRCSLRFGFRVAAFLAAGWLALLTAQERTFPRMNVTPIGDQDSFDEEPSMARAPDGSVYVAWVGFREGHDTLQVARYGIDKAARRLI